MIIAEQQIDLVNTRIFAEQDRLENFDNLPPARVRVTVRLPGASELRDAHLKCVLYVQQEGPDQLPWAEEGRLVLSKEETTTFQAFDTVFLTDRDYSIRVEFLVTQFTPEGEKEDSLGYASTALSDIVSTEEERLDVDLVNIFEERIPNAYAELSIDWLKFLNDKMVFDVRVKIDKSSGWPFARARPFYLLYKWEPQYSTWTPIYRSEVLTKGSFYPDSKGAMVLERAEIILKKNLDGDHDRPLRLEFFHYKTKSNPKMLGYLETSLRLLRQTRKGSDMEMELSTFEEGELVGELRLVNSKIAAGISFFCLEATFGGDIVGDFVYFDVSLTDFKSKQGWRRGGKPFYTIARYGDSKVWEKVYRSESAPRVTGRLHKYKVAKLTERRLNAGMITRAISIMLFQTIDGQRIVLGHIETTVAALLDAEAGAVLPMEGAGVGSGYVRVEQTEATESRTYFALHWVIERRTDRSTSTEEGVEEASNGQI